jgi:uncharacterized membrane protein YagU involved in acid resistance
MAIESTEYERVELGLEMEHWVIGAISGFLGGSLFGAMMAASPMMVDVASLFGLEDPAAGWLIHLCISIVFAWGYLSVVSLDQFEPYAQRPSTGAGLGLVYGVFLWFVGATIVMPLWLTGQFGIDANFVSFVGHLVYGVLLGVTYPVLLAHN